MWSTHDSPEPPTYGLFEHLGIKYKSCEGRNPSFHDKVQFSGALFCMNTKVKESSEHPYSLSNCGT